MSNSDSFIEEVTEEVRRDKLFALMRRYGWIGILAVLLLVGGAAYNAWAKARATAQAEVLGDNLLAALAIPKAADRMTALEKIQATGDTRAMLAMLVAGASSGPTSGAAAGAAPDPARVKVAADALRGVINNKDETRLYRDLAQLKLVMLLGPAMDKAARLKALKGLDVPGAPFRLLAEEQLAVIDVENGDKAAAITRLKAIVADNATSPGQAQRATQLIVTLGGKLGAG